METPDTVYLVIEYDTPVYASEDKSDCEIYKENREIVTADYYELREYELKGSKSGDEIMDVDGEVSFMYDEIINIWRKSLNVEIIY